MSPTHTPDPPKHNHAYALAHRMNGTLLSLLFSDHGLFSRVCPNIDVGEWIINVLYIVRVEEATGLRAALRTSSVLHRGHLYDNRPAPGNKVLRLDQPVPTKGSVTGRCIHSSMPIWLHFDDVASPRSLGRNLYRSYGHVDVKASELPLTEIVFPISLRTGLSSNAIGALNMEFFPVKDLDGSKTAEEMFLKREEIDLYMQFVLDAHSPFLQIATDLAWHRTLAERGGDLAHEEPSNAFEPIIKAHATFLQMAAATSQRSLIG